MVTDNRAGLGRLLGHPEMLLSLLPFAGLPADDNATVEYLPDDASRAEFRPVTVAKVTYPDDNTLMVVVEAQQDKDEDRKSAWPLCVAELYWKWRYPVVLLILCGDEEVAAWAREFIQLGPSGAMLPIVLSPGEFSARTDTAQRFAHAAGQADADGYPVRGGRTGTEPLKDARAKDAGRALLAVLARRGLKPAPDIVERVELCTDTDQILDWLNRAGQADAIHEIFE